MGMLGQYYGIIKGYFFLTDSDNIRLGCGYLLHILRQSENNKKLRLLETVYTILKDYKEKVSEDIFKANRVSNNKKKFRPFICISTQQKGKVPNKYI